MIFWGAALLLMALAGAPEGGAAERRTDYAQLSVRHQIIVRVPARPRPGMPPPQTFEWKEKKGPKCVPARAIAGATLLGRNSVDLILRNNSRIRAKLENSCPALDYYQGFYITPDPDGMICANRDVIRSRVGGTCGIDRFRTLKPVPKD
jgi:hypothetical protein